MNIEDAAVAELESMGLIVVEDEMICWVCEEPTHTIDINFEAPMHFRCQRQAWKLYDLECWRSDVRNGCTCTWRLGPPDGCPLHDPTLSPQPF